MGTDFALSTGKQGFVGRYSIKSKTFSPVSQHLRYFWTMENQRAVQKSFGMWIQLLALWSSGTGNSFGLNTARLPSLYTRVHKQSGDHAQTDEKAGDRKHRESLFMSVSTAGSKNGEGPGWDRV